MRTFEIDCDRVDRLGFPEAIYGAHKSVKLLSEILKDFEYREANALVTKLQADKAAALKNIFASSFYDEISGVFSLHMNESDLNPTSVGIIAAGASDLFVVNEAYYTLAYLGLRAERVVDVGVAGIHRLLRHLEHLRGFRVLIVVAGFEGALPTVVGGLLPQPVIAVPTSVGYGVAENGSSALHTMLASCANGIVVVNVDNGYGAAMAAYRILRNSAPSADRQSASSEEKAASAGEHRRLAAVDSPAK